MAGSLVWTLQRGCRLRSVLLAVCAVVISAFFTAIFLWFFHGTVHPCEFAKRKMVRLLSDNGAKPDFATIAGVELFFSTPPAPYDCVRFLLGDGAGDAERVAGGRSVSADEYFQAAAPMSRGAEGSTPSAEGEAISADEFFAR